MPLDPRALAAELATMLPDTLDVLARVVDIDSGSYDAAGVNRVQDVFADRLARAGFTIARVPLAGRGDQLTATLALGGNGPRVLVIGHADTVWPAGTAAAWPYARDGNRATGPGLGDMKGGVMMAIQSLTALRGREALAGLGEVRVIIVPDEEIGSPGSRAWIEDEARRADIALTLEPGRPGGGLVTGRGAVGAVYVEATGISAHCGSSRAAGASAVAALAGLVAPIEALTRLEDKVSATVGIFRGGEARQVVPHAAELHVDLRAPTQAAADALLDALRAIVARPPADPRTSVTLRGGFGRPAFPRGEGTAALYAIAEEIARDLAIPLFEVTSPGGSDGSFAAALGVATIDGLGPVTHDAVSRNEWIEVDTLVSRGALFGTLLARLAEEPGRLPRSTR